MIGIDPNAGSALILRVAVYPSMIGSWISIRMRSGRCFATAASACSPFSASVTSRIIARSFAISSPLPITRSPSVQDNIIQMKSVKNHQNTHYFNNL